MLLIGGDNMKKLLIFISSLLIINVFIYSTKDIHALEYNKIIVDIKGAVKNPGVYEVDMNTTTYDLIKLAGGLRSYADTSLINLSKKLNDEDVVIIYTIDEVNSLTTGDRSVKVIEKECMCPKITNVSCINSKLNKNIINLNTATLDELQKLNGIGKSKAEAIIEYRNKTPFTKIEDIMNVKGIGKSLYEKNKELIGI